MVISNTATAATTLPLVLGLVRDAIGLPPQPATVLAHSLQQRFRQHEEDEAMPRFLDANVLAAPTLALDTVAAAAAAALHGARVPSVAAAETAFVAAADMLLRPSDPSSLDDIAGLDAALEAMQARHDERAGAARRGNPTRPAVAERRVRAMRRSGLVDQADHPR